MVVAIIKQAYKFTPYIIGTKENIGLVPDYSGKNIGTVPYTWVETTGYNGPLLEKRVKPTLKEKFTNLSNVSSKGETLCHTGATTG